MGNCYEKERYSITYSGTNGLVNFTTSNLTHYVQVGNGKDTITLVEILY